MKDISFLSHLKVIMLLPFSVIIVIPTFIIYITGDLNIGWGLNYQLKFFPSIIGIIFIAMGLYLLFTTIKLFANVGKGTLASWNPTKKLVVVGPYRYVRNPMISGVLFILLGESILLGSKFVFTWCIIFFVVNHIYFVFLEEQGLVKRFGEKYIYYKQNVPRWIPRLKPWGNSEVYNQKD